MSDYFEHYEKLPPNILELVDRISNEHSYDVLKRLQRQLEKEGWTFSYGLDGEPFNLRPNILTT